jgi:hypothetical protein
VLFIIKYRRLVIYKIYEEGKNHRILPRNLIFVHPSSRLCHDVLIHCCCSPRYTHICRRMPGRRDNNFVLINFAHIRLNIRSGISRRDKGSFAFPSRKKVCCSSKFSFVLSGQTKSTCLCLSFSFSLSFTFSRYKFNFVKWKLAQKLSLGIYKNPYKNGKKCSR